MTETSLSRALRVRTLLQEYKQKRGANRDDMRSIVALRAKWRSFAPDIRKAANDLFVTGCAPSKFIPEKLMKTTVLPPRGRTVLRPDTAHSGVPFQNLPYTETPS